VKIVVTGAGGMLGRDVVAAARSEAHEVIGLNRADLDVTDGDAVERCLQEAGPDAVINCAAWTDVDGAEENESQAATVNVDGARNVATAAAHAGATVLYPSTDYVFDGSKDGPYVESDSTAPLNAYGRTKLAGEGATAATNPRSLIVRTAWLFGPGGKNFVETMLRLAADRDSVDVVRDQVGCPTYTGHLAAGLLLLVEENGHGVRHMAGEGTCSWFEFAREIFNQASVDCDVVPTTSDSVERKAKRPANSALISTHETPIVLPRWQRGLSDYLATRARSHAREAVS
jgi:dTDP-4-dehydrorhamnose reductase